MALEKRILKSLVFATGVVSILGFTWLLAYKMAYPQGGRGGGSLEWKEKHLDPSKRAYFSAMDLKDPQQAPPEIRDEVIWGCTLMQETELIPGIQSHMRCSNCHFNSGNTLGGINGSISLVGVAEWYPAYSRRTKKMQSLKERMNDCFERSMNSSALLLDDPNLVAMETYLNWISESVPEGEPTPWRGLISLHSEHTPDPERGRICYLEFCAGCHGKDGNGNQDVENNPIPPLWGEYSFNKGAGLTRIEKFSAFIYDNMPLGQPFLSEDEALDIAVYVLSQERPAFNPPPNPNKAEKKE